MGNVKELRGRIKSIGNIRQLTKAMEMVASMKLRRVQNKAVAYHGASRELRAMAARVSKMAEGYSELELPKLGEPSRYGVFVLSSDRGLCGAYNSKIGLEVLEFMDRKRTERAEATFRFWVYGKKAYTYLHKRHFEVERYFVDPPLDKVRFEAAAMVGAELGKAFLEGKVDEVYVAYTEFVSAGRFVPRVERLLPLRRIVADPEDEAATASIDYLVEPDPVQLIKLFFEAYLNVSIYDVMLQSLTSEHASRRMAMKNATEAAGRMLRELKLEYNRARQENITKELLDIIGGVNAIA